MKLKIKYLFVVLLLASCHTAYYVTKEGGTRLKNPTEFEYNKSQYTSLDKSLIDTNAIYLLDSSYNKWEIIKSRKVSGEFIRFFSTGQVLFISCDSMPTIAMINNKDLGTPGYFFIDGDKIKIDMFQNLNGGQTGKNFGRIQSNGNIYFYDQRPETFNESFSKLEKDGRKSFYKKIKNKDIEHYKPNW